jgi:membrane associated rhomboid family serine protease
MNELSRPDNGPLRFGTEAFYASIGRAFVVMCAVAPVLFLIEVLNWTTDNELAAAGGIRPRRLDGIDGILFAPFLHASFLHVTANSIPLILLGTFVLAGGVRRTLWSTAVITVPAGSWSAAGGTRPWRCWSGCSTAGSCRACCPVSKGSPGRATCSGSSVG